MDEALGRAERAVADCLATSAYALPPDALVECLDRAQALSQRVLSLQLALIREADARAVATAQGAANTAAWLRDRWRITPSTATRLVKLAAAAARQPVSAQALAAGVVNAEQLHVITAALSRLPMVHQEDGERFLLDQADVLGPRELGRIGERLLEVVDPDQADKAGREALEREERRAHHERCFSVIDIPGCTRVRVTGWLDREAAAIVRTALDPLCAPRPDPDSGLRNARSPAQRRADALTEVCRLALACGQLPDNGGDRPQLVVTIPLTTLQQQLNEVQLDGLALPIALPSALSIAPPFRPSPSAGTVPASGGEKPHQPRKPGRTSPPDDPGGSPSGGVGLYGGAAGSAPSGAAGSAPSSGTGSAPSSGAGLVPSSGAGLARSSGAGLARSSGAGFVRSSGAGFVPSGGAGFVSSSGTGSASSGGAGLADGWAGVLDDGGRISVAAARRMACDAGILPVVLGGSGQILDLGRQRRLFTGPLRRALMLRDGGCAFPGCDRPARWCDGHHIRHWADGGTTCLDNAVLLCGYHHRVIHHDEWTVRISPADGLPEFLPPILLDPSQRPRRNTCHSGHAARHGFRGRAPDPPAPP